MPLYEYECGSCNARTEEIQRFSDAPLEVCASCGGPLRKLISSPAIQFKGSGFYATDYSRAAAKEGSSSSAGEAKSTESSSEASPATPAAASEAKSS